MMDAGRIAEGVAPEAPRGAAIAAPSVLALQSALGNRATGALLRRAAAGRGRPTARQALRDLAGGAGPAGEPAGGECLRLLRESVRARRLARHSVAAAQKPNDQAARAALCVGSDDLFKGPEVIEFSPEEQRVASASLWQARSEASQATNNLSRGDPYVQALATKLFHDDRLDMNRLAATAGRIHDSLMSTPIQRGSCANTLCNRDISGAHVGAPIMADADVDHVKHAADTITICPFFFSPTHSLGERVLTWLHEAGHVARIDEPPAGQTYEHPPNCYSQRGENPFDQTGKSFDSSTACPGGNVNNVDNWAYFIDYVSRA